MTIQFLDPKPIKIIKGNALDYLMTFINKTCKTPVPMYLKPDSRLSFMNRSKFVRMDLFPYPFSKINPLYIRHVTCGEHSMYVGTRWQSYTPFDTKLQSMDWGQLPQKIRLTVMGDKHPHTYLISLNTEQLYVNKLRNVSKDNLCLQLHEDTEATGILVKFNVTEFKKIPINSDVAVTAVPESIVSVSIPSEALKSYATERVFYDGVFSNLDIYMNISPRYLSRKEDILNSLSSFPTTDVLKLFGEIRIKEWLKMIGSQLNYIPAIETVCNGFEVKLYTSGNLNCKNRWSIVQNDRNFKVIEMPGFSGSSTELLHRQSSYITLSERHLDRFKGLSFNVGDNSIEFMTGDSFMKDFNEKASEFLTQSLNTYEAEAKNPAYCYFNSKGRTILSVTFNHIVTVPMTEENLNLLDTTLTVQRLVSGK